MLIRRYFGTSSPAAPDIDQKKKRTETNKIKYLPQKTNKGTGTTAARNFSNFLLHPRHVSSADPLGYLASSPTPLPQFPEDHKNKLDLQKLEQM